MQRRCLLIDALARLSRSSRRRRLARELAQRFGLEVTGAQAERAIAAEIRYYRAHMNEGRDAARRRAAPSMRRGACAARCPATSRRRSTQALTEALLARCEFAVFADAARRWGRPAAGLRVVVVSNWDSRSPRYWSGWGWRRARRGRHLGGGGRRQARRRRSSRRRWRSRGSPPARRSTSATASSEDIAGARAAGIAAVLLNRDGAAAPTGVTTIASLAELAVSDAAPTPNLSAGHVEPPTLAGTGARAGSARPRGL